MRVVGGTARGRRLSPPAISGARPTSELMRGVIFNSLGPDIVRDAKVADLYAGVGSLGIECLSRGASHADFIERDPRQCAVIRKNLKSLEFQGSGKVRCVEALKGLAALEGPYRLILMDPPYAMESLDADLEAIDRAGVIESEGMLVVGHSKRLRLKSEYGALEWVRGRRHGDSVADFFISRRAQ